VIPDLGAEGPKRTNPNAPSNSGDPRPGGWREALLPQFQQQPSAQQPSGNYSTSEDGTFVFSPTSTQTTGVVNAAGQAIADIYYYQQPIAPYRPGSRFVGMGSLEERAKGTHLGSLAQATTIGEALWAYRNDPVANSYIVSAAREHYRGNPNFIDQWAQNFWIDVVNIAASTGNNPATVLDLINSGELSLNEDSSSPSSSYGGYGSYGSGGYGGGGGGGSVSLTDPTSARGLLLQTMQGVLGRNPSDKEYNQFIKALNQAEMNAPRTVTVEGDVAVQSGGVDPGMIAMEYVEGLEEFESAAGQRTLDAFMQVLGA
jgi:hypothetical protein